MTYVLPALITQACPSFSLFPPSSSLFPSHFKSDHCNPVPVHGYYCGIPSQRNLTPV